MRRDAAPPRERTKQALFQVETEVSQAMVRFPAFNSPHEGWAVIKEELDELWKHVMENTGRSASALIEARQIAAMAIRYMVELDDSAHQPIPEPVWKNPQKIGVDQ